MILQILLVTLFILFGILLSLGKCSFLIAGFNTMSKEEKSKYDVLSLCKFMGKVMFILAFCMTLFVLSHILQLKSMFNISLILFWILILFTVIYLNTGNRFMK
ncbi:MAG: DUF3784 domain-containing protein [Clostridium perfringens]|nr:DUF3784 domain-containing protein [Clostridium perfringens]